MYLKDMLRLHLCFDSAKRRFDFAFSSKEKVSIVAGKNKRELRPRIAHPSKRQTDHLNKPDSLNVSNYEKHWL